jgi:aminopeptidase-like protein
MSKFYTQESIEHSAKTMMELLYKISPLQRMINSSGLDESYIILQKHYPNMVIHEYESKREAEDWEVPLAWEATFGELRDSKSNLLASFAQDPLFVAAYSEDVDGYFTKQQIKEHVRVNKHLPEVFSLEHKNAYNYQLKTWGISLPYNLFDSMSDHEKYHIVIKTKTYENSMKVAEIMLKGESDKIVNIQAHIDELCNDDLSGCVVALELISHLAKIKDRKYTYQVLLFPEMIGAFFYTFNNQHILKNTIGVLNLETVGDGDTFCLKSSLKQDTYMDYILKESFLDLDVPFNYLDFFEGFGNDERVYSFGTIGIDGVSIQKYPYKYYHTSEDIPQNINIEDLKTSLSLSIKFCELLEKDYIPEFTTLNPPWLTKHGLYFDRESDPENFHKYNNELLFNIDGKNSVIDLCKMTGIRFGNIYNYLEKFIDRGFIKKNW